MKITKSRANIIYSAIFLIGSMNCFFSNKTVAFIEGNGAAPDLNPVQSILAGIVFLVMSVTMFFDFKSNDV